MIITTKIRLTNLLRMAKEPREYIFAAQLRHLAIVAERSMYKSALNQAYIESSKRGRVLREKGRLKK